jgi:TPP-dependent pyruvate/acetoin dehydrogenase alpha subunit
MRDPAAAVYRTKDEVEEEKQRDPIVGLRERLRAAGLLDEAAWDTLVERVEARVNDAVAFADASPEPPAEWLTADVYA